jgi:SAM-dependent methyltransferase
VALPNDRYASGLEIGCSIGVLTELLARRCDRLLAVDTSLRPLIRAEQRLTGQDHVRFRQMEVPSSFPGERFDLIVLSEVGYYWGYGDLERAIDCIENGMNPGATLILVHYTPYVPDYPLTGDEVHEAFSRQLLSCYHVRGERTERYRLDVWRKPGNTAPNG